MRYRHIGFLPCLLALALAACTSRDTQAANAASAAEAALQQGRNTDALRSINKALAARDDVSDYWILLGRIDTASNDLPGAFMAYANAFELDRGNVETLRLLCQLGLTVRAPDKVDHYADQLLLIDPTDTMPVIMKGNAALERNDTISALKFAEQVLSKAPQDSEALILKGRIMAANENYAAAAQFIEGSLAAGGDPSSRLSFLKELYTKAHDRPHYEWTIQRLAAAKPSDPASQITYADMLYQTGQRAAANEVLIRVAHQNPDSIEVASEILDTWLQEGPDALSLPQIRTQASNSSLEMQTAYAQFANEVGHPEIARALLEPALADASVTAGNADAKAALAYAVGLQGHHTDAIARLSEILEFDASHPRALLARARLEAADRNFTAAIEDARNAVAQDPHNATARLALADILAAHGDAVLAEGSLREAVRAMPGDARLSARLAQWLIQHGARDRARDVLRDLARAAPVSLRASRVSAALDPDAQSNAHAL